MTTDVKAPEGPEKEAPHWGNRWKHGLYSEDTLGPGEDPAALEELRDSLLEAMNPKNRLEAEIAANTV
ncbi:MAG TPA: hypothetical protein VF678_08660, partial [bacterium]